MAVIPEGGWLAEYDLTAEGRMARLFGVPRPRGSRSLRRPLSRYLRDMTARPWEHEEMADQAGRQMDVVLDALLRHHGINPHAMLLLSMMGAVPETRHGVMGEDTSLMPMANDGPRVRGIAWMSRGIRWDSMTERPFIHLRGRAMPETIANAAAGRPLASLVSHPAIDAMGLVVEGVEHAATGPRIFVRDVPTLTMNPPGGGEKTETTR